MSREKKGQQATDPQKVKGYFIGGGVGSLAAAVFMIRDGKIPGRNITILEALSLNGGSCDGAGNPENGYIIRGGRMMNLPTYECTWDLFSDIPSVTAPGKTVTEETNEFNAKVKTNSGARLVTKSVQKVDVLDMGFSKRDRFELLRLTKADEDEMKNTRISDWFSPEFFNTNFWYMWATTFAFQPWHSAAELRRYMIRFMHEFPRIQNLSGVARTTYNQYDSLIRPIEEWLKERGVVFQNNVTVTDLDLVCENDKWAVKKIVMTSNGNDSVIEVGADDVVFMQNGCITDAAGIGAMDRPAPVKTKADAPSFLLWEKVAKDRPEFGNPSPFCDHVPESLWQSYTVTLQNSAFFDAMERFSGNEAGTGALVTFKDSNWLMSVVLARQPHFSGQPEHVNVFWGYGLFPDRVGNFVNKPMLQCTGEEILRELCGHLRFEYDEVFGSAQANCIPVIMPFVDALFQRRLRTDRPLPAPKNSKNLGFISQFVEIPDDVIFTVEYSVRAAQIAVYDLLGIDKEIPAVHHYENTLKVKRKSAKVAYRKAKGPKRSKSIA